MEAISIETRTERAQAAIEAYMDMHPDYKEEGVLIYDDVIIDLIADLLHWSKADGMDTEAILRMAEGHYEEEKEK